MRLSSETYAAVFVALAAVFASGPARGQTVRASADQSTCAGLLSDAGAPAVGAAGRTDTARAGRDSALRNQPGNLRTRADSASFAIGGARNDAPDIILRASVHADQVRFASQPRVRVRLCWGGDTLRVVQRDNLPSPVVAGTTYRNVFVAVELLGRVNAECLANRIGVGNNAGARQPRTPSNVASASNCAFLGGSAAAGAQVPRTQNP